MDRTDCHLAAVMFGNTPAGDTQLRVHLGRLEELEYLLVHLGGRGQALFTNVFDKRE